MGDWILSFVLMAIEAWGSVYFYDIFLERKRKSWLDKCRYIILYFCVITVAFTGEYLGSMGIKAFMAVLMHMAFCAAFYRADWKQCIFFSVLNYALLLLADFLFVLVGNILMNRDGRDASVMVMALPGKLAWILLLSAVPLFTLAAILSIYFGYSSEKKCRWSTFSLRRGGRPS